MISHFLGTVGDDCCHTSCENEFYGAGDGEETFLLDE